MKKIIVFGAGLVGKAIILELCKKYKVIAVDIDKNKLQYFEKIQPVNTIQADISDVKSIQKIIKNADLVIGAVPGFLGFEFLQNVIKCGKNIVDISFFPEDPFQLDKFAKEQNVTAVVDCGVAPGMSNLILGYHNKLMKVESFECLVGGLPFERSLPYQYKAPFSPIDIIEEYTRPARIMENGKIITKPALSDAEYVDIKPIGTLEAFNTDGLRTLLKTMKIPNMKEKTLRYPGHIEYIRVLRETGFFDKEEIQIGNMKISPIDFTSKLLFPKWKLEADEPEFTLMEITIKGIEKGKRKEYKYHLFDRFDEKTKISSMARTTGYTCTAIADLILEGKFNQKGICPPEFIGAKADCFENVISYLKDRNINYKVEKSVLENM